MTSIEFHNVLNRGLLLLRYAAVLILVLTAYYRNN